MDKIKVMIVDDHLVVREGLRQLLEIEDDIRLKESRGEFDDEFIALARAVYVTNDKRAATIKAINVKSGSKLVGEKSYEEY